MCTDRQCRLIVLSKESYLVSTMKMLAFAFSTALLAGVVPIAEDSRDLVIGVFCAILVASVILAWNAWTISNKMVKRKIEGIYPHMKTKEKLIRFVVGGSLGFATTGALCNILWHNAIGYTADALFLTVALWVFRQQRAIKFSVMNPPVAARA